jgi:hypothetical protein
MAASKRCSAAGDQSPLAYETARERQVLSCRAGIEAAFGPGAPGSPMRWGAPSPQGKDRSKPDAQSGYRLAVNNLSDRD